MSQKMRQFVRIVLQDPAVQTIVGFAGGNTSSNQGRMFITLKPLSGTENVRRPGHRAVAEKAGSCPRAPPCLCSRRKT